MASINLQGDTSGSISISAPSVAGSNTLTLPKTTQTLATENALGVRNLIINGDMRIDQRNGGASVTPASGAYTLDRWLNSNSTDGVFTIQQTTDVPTGSEFTNSIKATVTTADTSITGTQSASIFQLIEGYNVSHLMFGSASSSNVTLSFWVKSTVTGTFNACLTNSDNSRSNPQSFTISSSNTWEKKTITFTGDTTGTWVTNNGIGLGVYVFMALGPTYQGSAGWNGSSIFGVSGQANGIGTIGNVFALTGVQLEVGDTATPFEHRPYDMELARCQRYYELINDNNYSSYGVMAGGTSQNFAGYVDYKQIKRATPTITITGSFLIQGNSNQPGTTSMGTNGIGKRAVYISGTGTGSNVTNGFAYNLLDVNGYIKVDAEL